jgi:hypothetical protein
VASRRRALIRVQAELFGHLVLRPAFAQNLANCFQLEFSREATSRLQSNHNP